MTSNELLAKISKSYEAKLPFVVFHKPEAEFVKAYFQKDDSLYHLKNYSQKGFVFAPFDSQRKAVLIPENNAEYSSVKFSELSVDSGINPLEAIADATTKKKHVELVAKGIEFIKSGNAQKVVLSRKEQILFKEFSPIKTFKNLLHQYPKAMVYLWFHPKTGLWMGATPETLVTVHENKFSTMALAGTQSFTESQNIEWQQKERDEQQYVTDFIESSVSDALDQLEISKPYTVKAGNLLHLRTDITGKLLSKDDLDLLVGKLHPTPAVCGLPKETAKQFILDNEGYGREFYTGFLGELNLDDKTDLFVNLRCMKVEGKMTSIFVGGGITLDSKPIDEWQETVEKSKVIKKALAFC